MNSNVLTMDEFIKMTEEDSKMKRTPINYEKEMAKKKANNELRQDYIDFEKHELTSFSAEFTFVADAVNEYRESLAF